MAQTDFLTAKPIAGKANSILLTCDADTYYIGMPLTFSSTYGYSITAIQAIVWEDKVLAAEGKLLCLVMGSEFPEASLVSDANVTITISETVKNAALLNGIILR